jgi:hypothetical protein
MILNIRWFQKHGPHRVYDASGKELTHLAWANTETGEVEELVKDKDGNFVLDGKSWEVLKVLRRYKAPLRVEKIYKESTKGRKFNAGRTTSRGTKGKSR